MSKRCYIVGAGAVNPQGMQFPDDCFVIAADNGLKYLQQINVIPNVIIGDFDSLGYLPKGDNVIYHQPEKDDTDMMLAVKFALAEEFDEIIIYGGLGGRFDHSYANIQTLSYIARQGAHGYLVNECSICTVIKNNSILFSKELTGVVSVFSISDNSVGVSLRGLKYELLNDELSNAFPLGVSNEFCGKEATIEVKDGTLLIIVNAKDVVDKFKIKNTNT